MGDTLPTPLCGRLESGTVPKSHKWGETCFRQHFAVSGTYRHYTVVSGTEQGYPAQFGNNWQIAASIGNESRKSCMASPRVVSPNEGRVPHPGRVFGHNNGDGRPTCESGVQPDGSLTLYASLDLLLLSYPDSLHHRAGQANRRRPLWGKKHHDGPVTPGCLCADWRFDSDWQFLVSCHCPEGSGSRLWKDTRMQQLDEEAVFDDSKTAIGADQASDPGQVPSLSCLGPEPVTGPGNGLGGGCTCGCGIRTM